MAKLVLMTHRQHSAVKEGSQIYKIKAEFYLSFSSFTRREICHFCQGRNLGEEPTLAFTQVKAFPHSHENPIPHLKDKKRKKSSIGGREGGGGQKTAS